MKKWTPTDIANRFEEAAYTLKRMPPFKIQGYVSSWPPILRTVMEQMQQEKPRLYFGPPQADAISRMEETIQWIFYIDDEDERRLVWLRAERVPWKIICCRIGCGRTKAWQMWVMALLRISTRLNPKLGRIKSVRTKNF